MILGKILHKDMHQKAGKINVSARGNLYMSNYERPTLLNSFCRSRLCYCSFSWMYHGQTLKKKTVFQGGYFELFITKCSLT